MTIPELFKNAVKRYGRNPLLWEKTTNEYISMSYDAAYKKVCVVAQGLLSLGLKKNDKVVLLSEGRSDWIISELAVLFSGGVCVPVSVKIDELLELKFRIDHSDSRYIIVSARQLYKIEKLYEGLPKVEKIIVMDAGKYPNDTFISLDEVINQGTIYSNAHPGNLDEFVQQIVPNDLANICYTSGTTADPKGIMLSHLNYTANAEQSCTLFDVPQWYVSLMILPWDHSFAHTVGIYTLMKNGASIASVQMGKTALETLKNIPLNIKETKPVFLLSVPALAKNFKNSIEKSIREKGKFAEMLFTLALKIAYFYNSYGFNKGKGLRIIARPLHGLFHKMLFKKIRAAFGGRLNFFVGGGALLDMEFQKFFYAIGIPMYQGYGLSEASPVIASNTPEFHKLGSSGKPVVNMLLRIRDEKGNDLPTGQKGEIVVKGHNVMVGYWKNENATAETIRNGWLYTGDVGYVDVDGFLYVMGRFKSLLISSDGEKYSPEAIEEALVATAHLIEQVMLCNNQMPYTVALVVLNATQVRNYIQHKQLHSVSNQATKLLLKAVQHQINEYAQGGKHHGMFPQRWIPSSFAIIDEAFSEQNGMINSTMKMVRGKITAAYLNRINHMYTSEGKDVCNSENLKSVAMIATKS
ncbi:MAG: AMP-binding protein [Bacteroidota bacterium]